MPSGFPVGSLTVFRNGGPARHYGDEECGGRPLSPVLLNLGFRHTQVDREGRTENDGLLFLPHAANDCAVTNQIISVRMCRRLLSAESRSQVWVASFGFEASKMDHFLPLLRIRGDELSELLWRHRH